MSEDTEKDRAFVEEQESRLREIVEDTPGRQGSRAGAPQQDAGEDEDDETWTNQPGKTTEKAAGEDLEGDDVDDHEEEDDAEETRASRRSIQNGRDVLCEELPERAQRAALRLKPFLTGVLVIEFSDSGERFVFDWREETPKTHPISRDVLVTIDAASAPSVEPTKITADAIIIMADKHVMAVRSGDLNPQVGMLTDKIRVKGKVSSAVYLFNLIAPRARH
jgi:hypothetical protein